MGIDAVGTSEDERTSSRLQADIAAICDLVNRGMQVDGEVVVGERWGIYGRTAYDGELLLAEYDDPAEAAAVLAAIPPPARPLPRSRT